MARTWTISASGCSLIYLLSNDLIHVEKTWHEISPTQAATLPSGTKMKDANDKELTLLDGYCTTYFYTGWQTSSPMKDGKIGKIIDHHGVFSCISDAVGPTVGHMGNWFQIVRLPDDKIPLPTNLGKNLISDLYPGIMWGTKRNNWYNQWDITPLAPANGSISDQKTDLPRSFSIDETNIPGYGTETNKSFYAPELFAPYMYYNGNVGIDDGIYVGGIIVVIGVKKLSSGAKSMPFDEDVIESPSTDNESVIESPSTEIQQAEALNDNVEDKELS